MKERAEDQERAAKGKRPKRASGESFNIDEASPGMIASSFKAT